MVCRREAVRLRARQRLRGRLDRSARLVRKAGLQVLIARERPLPPAKQDPSTLSPMRHDAPPPGGHHPSWRRVLKFAGVVAATLGAAFVFALLHGHDHRLRLSATRIVTPVDGECILRAIEQTHGRATLRLREGERGGFHVRLPGAGRPGVMAIEGQTLDDGSVVEVIAEWDGSDDATAERVVSDVWSLFASATEGCVHGATTLRCQALPRNRVEWCRDLVPSN